MPLTLATIATYVNDMLGSGIVAIELTASQIQTSIATALRLYNSAVPGIGHGTVPYGTGNVRIVVPDPLAVDIMDVQFINRLQINQGDLVENPFLLANALIGYTRMSASEYHLYAAYSDDARRIYSAEPEWLVRREWNGTTEVMDLVLYVDRPEYTPFVGCYYYTWHRTPDDADGTGLATLPPEHEQWILSFVLCRAKQALGRGLRKFQGIPSTDGSDMTLDGPDLITDGREEELALKDELDLLRRPIPPITG